MCETDETIEFIIKPEENDFINFMYHYWYNRNKIIKIFLFGFIGLLYLFMILFDPAFFTEEPFNMILLPLLIFYAMFPYLTGKRMYKNKLKGDMHCKISKEEIYIKAEDAEQRLNCNLIYKISENKRSIFLWIQNNTIAITIPKRFLSEYQIQFLRDLKK